MYKVLLLKVQLHDGVELRATVSYKTLQLLSLGCRKHASRFVPSFLEKKKYGLCILCDQSLLNDIFRICYDLDCFLR